MPAAAGRMTNMAENLIGILDCTLRDGGYYTNWDFDDRLLGLYLDAMAANPSIYAVEIGYRSPPKGQYNGRFFHVPKRVIDDVRRKLRPDQKIAVMLNEKDCAPEAMEGLLGDLRDDVAIVRFATAPNNLSRGVESAAACTELGFEVGLNVMYMNTYIDKPEVLKPLANAHANYVALVDSYGSCMPGDVTRIFNAAKDILPQPLGFHGHDNISLAFANSIAALESGALCVDATIQGMGRGAGNLKTELAISYLATHTGAAAEFSSLAKAVAAFDDLRREHEWGTNLAYMISGFASLPQADVMNWFGTRRYGLGSIVAALQHQNEKGVDDHGFPDLAASPLAKKLAGRPVLVVGGGESVNEHVEALKDLARKRNAVIIHSTTRRAAALDSAEGVQFYCLAGQELQRLRDGPDLLARPNRYAIVQEPPRLKGTAPAGQNVYQVGRWLPEGARGDLGPVADEPPLDLAFAVANALEASAIYLAGFDGYRNATLADQQNAQDVQRALDAATQRWRDRTVAAVTPTLYSVASDSVYSLCQSHGDA